MYCSNFAFGRSLPSTSILRQLKSEQNIKFYLNFAQYVIYPSATVQSERRIINFAKFRVCHSASDLVI